MQKVALITGVTGQDGSYLAEFLLNKGYIVHGIKRRSSSFNTARIDHLYRDPHTEGVRFFLHHGDLTDSTNLIRIIQQTQPDEIYNLAAQSHVAVSFELPEYFDAINKDVQVYVSSYKCFGNAWGEVLGNTLYITASEAGTYNIQVVGVRNDKAANDEFAEFGVEYQEVK